MKTEIRRLNLEVTNYCNYNCTICPDRKERRAWWIDAEVVDYLLGKLKTELPAKYNQHFLPEVRLFISGEPSFHFDLARIVRYCQKYGFKCLIHSNGSNWKKSLSDQIGELNYDKLTVSFSLDGGSKEQYQAIRGVDNFHKVIKNIKYFCSVDRKATKIVQCIYMPDVAPTPAQILDSYTTMFAECNVSINIRRAHNWNKRDSVKGSQNKSYGPLCDFMYGDLVLYSDLNVGLCCACLNQELTFGHILNDFHGSLADAFYGSQKRRDMRDAMRNRKTVEVCSGCERYSLR